MWIDANLNETQLRDLRIGQPAEVVADMYGSRVSYHGRVLGLNAGTGSALAVLPAQNASGNWIKIVQRLPVRISLAPEELSRHPLLLGLSTTVRIDTQDLSGAALSRRSVWPAAANTEVYADQMAGVEEEIDSIVSRNLGSAARTASAGPVGLARSLP